MLLIHTDKLVTCRSNTPPFCLIACHLSYGYGTCLPCFQRGCTSCSRGAVFTMVGYGNSRGMLTAPLLVYGLGGLLHAITAEACTCPDSITATSTTFPFTTGAPFNTIFADLVDQCAAPLTDTCPAPSACQCVDADFLVPVTNFVLNLGVWNIQLASPDVDCSVGVATCLVSFIRSRPRPILQILQ